MYLKSILKKNNIDFLFKDLEIKIKSHKDLIKFYNQMGKNNFIDYEKEKFFEPLKDIYFYAKNIIDMSYEENIDKFLRSIKIDNLDLIDSGGDKDKVYGAIFGLIVGDTLGAPLEFSERDIRHELKDMRGGGILDLPVGCWTDDSSMALCLLNSINENHKSGEYGSGFNLED